MRNYGIGIGKTAVRLGEGRSLASVADEEIGEALELLWGSAAVNTWNARRASVGSWHEVLGVNIEELNLAGRRCAVKAKGARAKARRRGQAREDLVLETVYWDAGTARLLPRLLRGRTRGPVFITHRRPGPGKVLVPHDVCPDTGCARLSYELCHTRSFLNGLARDSARLNVAIESMASPGRRGITGGVLVDVPGVAETSAPRASSTAAVFFSDGTPSASNVRSSLSW